MFWNAYKEETARRIDAEKRAEQQKQDLRDKVQADMHNWTTRRIDNNTHEIRRCGVVVGWQYLRGQGQLEAIVPDHLPLIDAFLQELAEQEKRDTEEWLRGVRSEAKSARAKMVDEAAGAMADLMEGKA